MRDSAANRKMGKCILHFQHQSSKEEMVREISLLYKDRCNVLHHETTNTYHVLGLSILPPFGKLDRTMHSCPSGPGLLQETSFAIRPYPNHRSQGSTSYLIFQHRITDIRFPVMLGTMCGETRFSDNAVPNAFLLQWCGCRDERKKEGQYKYITS